MPSAVVAHKLDQLTQTNKLGSKHQVWSRLSAFPYDVKDFWIQQLIVKSVVFWTQVIVSFCLSDVPKIITHSIGTSTSLVKEEVMLPWAGTGVHWARNLSLEGNQGHVEIEQNHLVPMELETDASIR
jgi:hypothetical protein